MRPTSLTRRLFVLTRSPVEPSTQFEPGKCVSVGQGVRRIVAGNAGLMTGPGTNTCLVGVREVAVLDPGPDDVRHLDAILTAAGPAIRWIIVTHTHPDHSPLAANLARRTGARVIGLPPPADGRQDESFVTQYAPADGERLSPDGDMAAYLRSLDKLHGLDFERIAPGHGGVMDRGKDVLASLRAHRLAREQKVLRALGLLAGATLDELTPVVYDHVDAARHRWARLTLEAHLIKLAREQRVSERGGIWRICQP